MHAVRTSATVTAALTLALLTACGSSGGGSPASDGGGSSDTAMSNDSTASTGSGGGSHHDSVSGPCDVTDQATVASVFPGAGAGKAGQVRNCVYTFSSGAVKTVNIFYFQGLDLAQYKKEDTDNGIKFTTVDVGDGGIRDQLHTVVAQQGDLLFGVQALGTSLTAASQAKNDPQVLALAKKIAAQH